MGAAQGHTRGAAVDKARVWKRRHGGTPAENWKRTPEHPDSPTLAAAPRTAAESRMTQMSIRGRIENKVRSTQARE